MGQAGRLTRGDARGEESDPAALPLHEVRDADQRVLLSGGVDQERVGEQQPAYSSAAAENPIGPPTTATTTLCAEYPSGEISPALDPPTSGIAPSPSRRPASASA